MLDQSGSIQEWRFQQPCMVCVCAYALVLCSHPKNCHMDVNDGVEAMMALCRLVLWFCAGGQKARVVFADISLMEPDVLILVRVPSWVVMCRCFLFISRVSCQWYASKELRPMYFSHYRMNLPITLTLSPLMPLLMPSMTSLEVCPARKLCATNSQYLVCTIGLLELPRSWIFCQ